MIDWTSNDAEREGATQERDSERKRQIAMRHFRRPWNCHPETNAADDLDPAEEPGDVIE